MQQRRLGDGPPAPTRRKEMDNSAKKGGFCRLVGHHVTCSPGMDGFSGEDVCGIVLDHLESPQFIWDDWRTSIFQVEPMLPARRGRDIRDGVCPLVVVMSTGDIVRICTIEELPSLFA